MTYVEAAGQQRRGRLGHYNEQLVGEVRRWLLRKQSGTWTASLEICSAKSGAQLVLVHRCSTGLNKSSNEMAQKQESDLLMKKNSRQQETNHRRSTSFCWRPTQIQGGKRHHRHRARAARADPQRQEPPPSTRCRSLEEGEVEEANQLTGQIGAQRSVHARVPIVLRLVVDPGASHVAGALEHHGLVALASRDAR